MKDQKTIIRDRAKTTITTQKVSNTKPDLILIYRERPFEPEWGNMTEITLSIIIREKNMKIEYYCESNTSGQMHVHEKSAIVPLRDMMNLDFEKMTDGQFECACYFDNYL